MDRTTPAAGNEEIELYIRTIYSLLRSSGPIRLRSLEETHIGMKSNLHHTAGTPKIDASALVYAAARLPACFPDANLVLLGQMEEVFRRKGYAGVENWPQVSTPARRRKMHFNGEKGILAALIASVSDIDDMVPTMVAYQIEWNKLHDLLNMRSFSGLAHPGNGVRHDGWTASPDAAQLLANLPNPLGQEDLAYIQELMGLSDENFAMLRMVWPGENLLQNLRKAATQRLDIQINVLGSGLSDYRRASQLWWQQVEEAMGMDLSERPIYFVSSNTHSITNLISGFVWQHQQEIIDLITSQNPEDLRSEYERLQRERRKGQLANFLYYASKYYLGHPQWGAKVRQAQAEQERAAGIVRLTQPQYLDVASQIISVRDLNPDGFDPRLGPFTDDEIELLSQSDALILNIDYPLGMAAYHIFSQVSTAISHIMGIYIMGKAASLNGRVGDVMIPNVVYDEHSRNSFLFRNSFTALDVAPYLNYGTVFDNQKSVTVRGTFLQNREFMHVFYEESYTDIEMEAGPYLSAIYEDIYPKRHPVDEIVNIFINAPYDIGILHYASDTPISKRQSLLSKSLSYFGVDATYATSVPIVQRILRNEIDRQSRQRQVSARQPLPLARP
jgi:hypothetical protein